MRIKVALHEANGGIARQLAELMLVRGQIAFYEGLDTSEFRTVTNRDDTETKVTRDVVVSQVEVLAKVEELKNKLDSLEQGFSGIRDHFKEPEYVDVAKGYPILENPTDGDGWVQLLKSDSSRANCCAWDKLDGWNWAELLVECPQFADCCDWSKLDAHSWSHLLAATHAFDVRCDFSIFNGVEWIFILKHRPDLSPHLDWSILNDRDTARIKKILGMPL